MPGQRCFFVLAFFFFKGVFALRGKSEGNHWIKPNHEGRAVNSTAYAFSNQKTQMKWRVGPHVNSRTKPLARFPPNNRSRERLFGRRVETRPFRSFTSGPTHQKRRVSWFESAYARVFATSEEPWVRAGRAGVEGTREGRPAGIRCRRAGARPWGTGAHDEGDASPASSERWWRGSGARRDP